MSTVVVSGFITLDGGIEDRAARRAPSSVAGACRFRPTGMCTPWFSAKTRRLFKEAVPR
jgi:hypothetical protein